MLIPKESKLVKSKKGTVLFSVRCRDRFPNGPFGERTLQIKIPKNRTVPFLFDDGAGDDVGDAAPHGYH